MFYQRILEKRTVSLRKLGENRATEVKFGRFLSNKKVTVKELIEQQTNKTAKLALNHHVLAIQDTTQLNHHAHAGRAKGLGPLGDIDQIGLFLHPLLVLEAQSGACLGLADVYTWIRKELPPEVKKTSSDYRKKRIEDKESYRWLEVAARGKSVLKEAKLVTIIADRESDIYEEWYRLPDEKTHLLTRSSYNRRLGNGEMLFDYTAKLDVAGTYEIEVRERTEKRSKHRAKLEVRFGEIEITKPYRLSDKKAPGRIKLSVVDVKEKAESVIENEEPIHWRLLTTHDISTFEQAVELIKWYCWRWNIEQLFRTLKKQGFQVETSQLETGEGLTKLSVIALFGAVQTMQLTMAKDKMPDRPASDVFMEEEVEVLEAMQLRLEGKTEKQKNGYKKRSLAWAAWIIARIGGWKGYKSERPPGPITMLRGQQKFASICQGWFLARNVCIP